MPIRPENRDKYPDDWADISLRIRNERANGRCECEGECGIDHKAEIISLGYDHVTDDPGRCHAENHESHRVTGSIVVLTVAHLDHEPSHCDDDNLKAFCQRCHLTYDAPMKRQRRLERERAASAVGDLFQNETGAPKDAR